MGKIGLEKIQEKIRKLETQVIDLNVDNVNLEKLCEKREIYREKYEGKKNNGERILDNLKSFSYGILLNSERTTEEIEAETDFVQNIRNRLYFDLYVMEQTIGILAECENTEENQ